MMRIMARRMKAATVLAADSSGATRRPAARRGCARGSERLVVGAVDRVPSTRVNSPSNDDENLLDEIEPAKVRVAGPG
jgi:hypothetical protein